MAQSQPERPTQREWNPDRSVFDGDISAFHDWRLGNVLVRVYEALLAADGRIIPLDVLRTIAPSADSRVRDLRKPRFGGFSIPCVPCNKSGTRWGYYLDPDSVTEAAEALVYSPAREVERATAPCPHCGGAGRVTAGCKTRRRGSGGSAGAGA